MQADQNRQGPLQWTAAIVTVAAFAKTFIPFYLIGSTAVFLGSSALGAALIVMSWPSIRNYASNVMTMLILLAAFYFLVIANFLSLSRPAVPVTFLLGILIFHGMFLIFGLAAARAVKTVLLVLLTAASIYSIMLIQHAIRFGGLTSGIYIDDIFGVGNRIIYISFHQNIGLVISLGMLAAFGLASHRINKLLALAAVPFILFLLFHIAARTALLALLSSLVFLGFSACWVRSKRLATLSAAALVILATITSAIFYQRALQDDSVESAAPDALSRTVRELQNPNPGFRMQIWSRTLHRIANDPNLLLFGHGIGMYPVIEGFGAPDWLLQPTEGSKYYPHNVHLELLYEAGLAGVTLYIILTFFPLIVSLRFWDEFSSAEKAIVSIYVFSLVSSDISGAFAASYQDRFFLALTIGIIATKRIRDLQLDGTGKMSDPTRVGSDK
jgi:hypothetical protein